MNILLKTAIAGGALALACGANADVVFSQPYDGLGTLFASQNDPIEYGNFATTWDDFQLSGTTNVNGVAWTGGYFNPPTPAAITQFFLGIYADSGGTPGALLASGYFSGNASENCFASPVCSYSVSFGDYQLNAGTYWLSIVPDLAFPPQWGWATSAVGTNNAYQCFLGTCGSTGANMAFDVLGTPAVPEPQTWALMLLGLGGVGVFARSRRKAESSAA
jgi:hypothetical protein